MEEKTWAFPLDRIIDADKNERLAAAEDLNRILSDVEGDVFIGDYIGDYPRVYVSGVTRTEYEWDSLTPDIILETQCNHVRIMLSKSECIGKTLLISTIGYNAYEIIILSSETVGKL